MSQYRGGQIKQTHLVTHGDGHALGLGPNPHVAGDGSVIGGLLETEIPQHVLPKDRAGVEGGTKVVAFTTQRLWWGETAEVGYLCHVIEVGSEVCNLGADCHL